MQSRHDQIDYQQRMLAGLPGTARGAKQFCAAAKGTGGQALLGQSPDQLHRNLRIVINQENRDRFILLRHARQIIRSLLRIAHGKGYRGTIRGRQGNRLITQQFVHSQTVIETEMLATSGVPKGFR